MCHRDTARSLDPLRNPSKGQTYRIVPPFSLQTLQRNTKVLSRCGFNATESRKMVSSSHRPAKITLFRMYYQRGDLPIKVEYLSGGVRVIWTVDLAKIDIGFYLPLFFDGLAETQHPYKLYARQGVKDLINYGRDKIYPIIPQLILPIKNALNTQNVEVICVILDILQQMVKASDLIGPALIPFYRQLLPMFNTYKAYNGSSSDKIDYAQMKNNNLSSLIEDTLQVLEKHGGEDAFINIKYMVPTYESCLLN